MSRKRICIKSPEIVMSGDINISSNFNVVTKAKLDSVAVGGDCECHDLPKPLLDVVMLVDGSDSFGNKAKDTSGAMIEAFPSTLEYIQNNFVPQMSQMLSNRNTFTLVQFSGVSQLEGAYVPGSNGDAGSGLKHYNVEVAPQTVGRIRDITGATQLDGNGQLYLCVQDLCLPGFTQQLSRAARTVEKQERKRILICITDEEWDIKALKNNRGQKTSREEVCKLMHQCGYEPFAVVVRPNHFGEQNNDFIENEFCRNKSNNLKVYTDSFEGDMKTALETILNKISK